MRIKRFLACLLLLACGFCLAGCGEFDEDIKQINAGVETLGTLENGHILMTAHTAAKAGLVQGYDADYTYEYWYRIDVRTFNYRAEKRNLLTGNLLEPAYRVIDAHKYDLATGQEDEEYSGKIGDLPDLLTFFFNAGLKSGYVGNVEVLQNPEHPEWRGWRVHKNDKYIKRVNSSRSKDGADGLMLENYVDYWLDANGVLVRMEYFSRDSITIDLGDGETAGGENDASQADNAVGDTAENEKISDEIEQLYVFELLDYNNPEIANF